MSTAALPEVISPRLTFVAAALVCLAGPTVASAQDASAWDKQPHAQARLLAGARALDSVRVEGAPVDRDLLDAATELNLVAGGATIDLTKRGRARAAAWADAVRRIS